MKKTPTKRNPKQSGKAASGRGGSYQQVTRRGEAKAVCWIPPDFMRMPYPQLPPDRASHIVSINASHRREVTDLSDRYNAARLQNETLEKKVKEMFAEIKILRSRNASQLKKLESQHRLHENLQYRLQEQTKKHAEKSRFLEKLEAQVAHSGGKGKVLADRLDDLQKLVKTLKLESHNFCVRSEEAESLVKQRESEMLILRRSLENFSKGVDPANHLTIATLLHVRSSLEAENKQLSRNNAELLSDVKKLHGAVEENRASYWERIKDFREEASKSDARANSLEKEVDELRKDKGNKEQEIHFLDDQLGEVKQRFGDLTKAYDDLKKRYGERELAVTRLKKQILSRKSRVGRKDAQNSATIEQKNVRIQEAKMALENSDKAVKALIEERDALRNSLSQSMSQFNRHEQASQEKIMSLYNELKSEKSLRLKMADKAYERMNQINDLRERLDSAQKSIRKLMEAKNVVSLQLREETQSRKASQDAAKKKLEEDNRNQAKRIGDLVGENQVLSRKLRLAKISAASDKDVTVPPALSREELTGIAPFRNPAPSPIPNSTTKPMFFPLNSSTPPTIENRKRSTSSSTQSRRRNPHLSSRSAPNSDVDQLNNGYDAGSSKGVQFSQQASEPTNGNRKQYADISRLFRIKSDTDPKRTRGEDQVGKETSNVQLPSVDKIGDQKGTAAATLFQLASMEI